MQVIQAALTQAEGKESTRTTTAALASFSTATTYDIHLKQELQHGSIQLFPTEYDYQTVVNYNGE